MREDETPPTLRGKTCPVWSHLLGVGPVPEDGVAVGHHFGTGLLAKYTHQQHQADEEDHFHLQHHYSESSARIPLRCRVKSVEFVRTLQPGQVVTSNPHFCEDREGGGAGASRPLCDGVLLMATVDETGQPVAGETKERGSRRSSSAQTPRSGGQAG
ncbi:hypothetical protein GBF38_004106 [Nibea albiflora]|uniref:Uncharacterized protein n=1 Tax=Nibea albiflora TaxID=240163 RepID=A0ACB7FCP3_NIBAL|nr:hypothetical protein GBF38_004106 [Nibea albiflora]